MTTDARAEIKARLDILDVIGGHVSLHRSGTQHVGLCPFHAERTPSFSVSQQRQAWYCHGCHEGGDIFTFVEKIEQVDFPRALELLAERAGVELEKDRRGGGRGAGRRRAIELNERAAKFYEYVLWTLPAGEAGRRLLTERGVDEALARRFRVGFAPQGGQAGDALSRYLVGRGGASLAEVAAAGLAGRGGRDLFRHRLVFPISDERGQVLGFGGRALGDAIPKYLNTPETGAYHKSTALFGLDQARPALRERRVAVVVEGYFDVLAAHAAGVAHVVASSGTALTREQVRIIARHADQVVLCFDGDAAGTRAADTAVDLCAAERLPARIAVMPPEFKDPDEMVRSDPAAFAATISGAEPEWHVLLLRATAGTGGGVDERRRAGERVAALLRRIPDENTRELYAREGAQRLEVSASSLVASALTEVRAANLTRARSAVDRGAPPPAASPRLLRSTRAPRSRVSTRRIPGILRRRGRSSWPRTPLSAPPWRGWWSTRWAWISVTWAVRRFATSSSWPDRCHPSPAFRCTPWVPPTGGWRRASRSGISPSSPPTPTRSPWSGRWRTASDWSGRPPAGVAPDARSTSCSPPPARWTRGATRTSRPGSAACWRRSGSRRSDRRPIGGTAASRKLRARA